MIEKELEEKKTLLKVSIIDAGYDPNKFLDFCLIKKPGGEDLNVWTLDELKTAVSEFTEKNKNLSFFQHPSLEHSIKDQDLQKDIENMNLSKPEEIKPPSTINIKCRILEKTPLNDKQIKVIVRDPKPVVTNFLSSNYVEYDVYTEAMNWSVKRRYSDFEWLRQVLVKFNPGFMIPPLPNKKIGKRRFEMDFIKKRMKFLQKFIDAVTEKENLKAMEPLIAFLSMTDHNQFSYKMKELSSYQPSPYVNEFRTFTGEIVVAPPEEKDKEKYYVNITNYFKIQTKLFERLNESFKDYHKYINLTCIALNDIQKDFETLHLLNSRVLMKDNITKSFQELGMFFRQWKRTTFKQGETVKLFLKDFFKFMRMECNAYSELIIKRNSVKAQYSDEKKKLDEKKEKLWQAGDVSKWEIIDNYNGVDYVSLKSDKNYALSKMCTQSSNHINNLGLTLGYYNRQNMEELKKLMKDNCNRYMADLKTFTDEFYPTLTDLLNMYTKIQIFVNSYQPQ